MGGMAIRKRGVVETEASPPIMPSLNSKGPTGGMTLEKGGMGGNCCHTSYRVLIEFRIRL